MIELLGYETIPERTDSGISATYVNTDSDNELSDRKYTLMKKKEFTDYVKGKLFALNVVNISQFLDGVDIPRTVKILKTNNPFWVVGYHRDFNVEESQNHVKDYFFAGERLAKLLFHDYASLTSEEFAPTAPKSEARIVANRILSASPAIAQYQMFVNEIDPLYEPNVNAFYDGKDPNKMVCKNEDYRGFSLGDFSEKDAVTEIDYLNELLECAKNFKEEDYTFFIDDKDIPMILPTNEFYSKYLFENGNNSVI